MSVLGVIGGTGLDQLDGLQIARQEEVTTPYGAPSGPLLTGDFKGLEMVFIARHGPRHSIPPHLVNYRANLWAMRQSGVTHVIGVAAVGGITERMAPGVIAVPRHIIDYTWGREHTIFELDQVEHVDFTEPYCAELRKALLDAAAKSGVDALDGGTYGATQGPRLESSAEIARHERDGCDMVGMTGMPEASLARELGLCYASCAMVVNWAAGKEEGPITMEEIKSNLRHCIRDVKKLLATISL